MLEVVTWILGGLIRLLAHLAMLLSSVAVASPQAFQAGYGLSPRGLADVLGWPVRAAAQHPGRLGIVLVVAAICVTAISVAAAWCS